MGGHDHKLTVKSGSKEGKKGIEVSEQTVGKNKPYLLMAR